MNRVTGVVALTLGVALLGASGSPSPHLKLATPWVSVTPPAARGDETQIEEWALSNGLPGDQPPAVTQYVQISSTPGGEGGLGGFVADRINGMNGSHDVSKMSYGKIDECLRPAWLFTLDDRGTLRSYEEVVFAVGGTLYEARYSRPTGQAENAAAHAAILDFCNFRAVKP